MNMNYLYILLLLLLAINLFIWRKNIVKFQDKLVGDRKLAFSDKTRELRIIFVIVILILLAISYMLAN